MVLLRFFLNRLKVVTVIHCEHTPEGIGAEVFDEGSRDLVTILKQQPFEFDGITKWTAVRHDARGINQRILTHACWNAFAGAPLADGIVLIECQSQWINVAMTGRTTRVLRVCFNSLADSDLGARGRNGLDRNPHWPEVTAESC